MRFPTDCLDPLPQIVSATGWPYGDSLPAPTQWLNLIDHPPLLKRYGTAVRLAAGFRVQLATPEYALALQWSASRMDSNAACPYYNTGPSVCLVICWTLH